jgi:excisionase family DNA binding protein
MAKPKAKKPSMAELPEILTAQHIADYLAITRKTVYELFKLQPESGGIPCFNIGTSKRVDKDDFYKWIQVRKGQRLKAG